MDYKELWIFKKLSIPCCFSLFIISTYYSSYSNSKFFIIIIKIYISLKFCMLFYLYEYYIK